MNDAGKMQVHRDVLGKVLYIDWNEEGEDDKTRRRDFEYFNDGTISKLTDIVDDAIVFETWFDENECDISGKHTKSDFLKFIFDFENM